MIKIKQFIYLSVEKDKEKISHIIQLGLVLRVQLLHRCRYLIYSWSVTARLLLYRLTAPAVYALLKLALSLMTCVFMCVLVCGSLLRPLSED